MHISRESSNIENSQGKESVAVVQSKYHDILNTTIERSKQSSRECKTGGEACFHP